MAKKRYVDTRFWHDSFIREHLNPLDRYLFLYFLTNDKTSICGVYELPMSMVSSETGIEKEMLLKMFRRLKGRVDYVDGWVAIKNFQKYQATSNPKIKTAIDSELSQIPSKIRDKIAYLYPMDTQSHLNLNSDSNLNLDSNLKTASPKDVVNYFFDLKGWGNKDKDFYAKKKIIYSRFLRPAKELLELCDGELEEAKSCLLKLSEWAISRDLDWGIETVFKKWYDLDLLKPKEKKPYYEGKRIFQRSAGGKWFCISRDGEIRELGILPKKELIIWK